MTRSLRQSLIERNWPDILSIAATILAGSIAPSQILCKLPSHPRVFQVLAEAYPAFWRYFAHFAGSMVETRWPMCRHVSSKVRF
ncbi:Tn3 family transposase [Aquamicrobium defluvii]|uniref:Tn3 family transposase n=1 Tax=Aquamicrobium defluvii TaxID=69279 RepID=UPI003CCB2FFB